MLRELLAGHARRTPGGRGSQVANAGVHVAPAWEPGDRQTSLQATTILFGPHHLGGQRRLRPSLHCLEDLNDRLAAKGEGLHALEAARRNQAIVRPGESRQPAWGEQAAGGERCWQHSHEAHPATFLPML